MGNTMSAMVGSVIVFYLYSVEKLKELFFKQSKQKNFLTNHEIILKDDENQVDLLSNDAIKKMISKQHKMKQNNEYKVIKSSIIFEESECLKDNEVTPGRDIECLKNEIKDISLDVDNYNNTNHHESIEDIKKQILIDTID